MKVLSISFLLIYFLSISTTLFACDPIVCGYGMKRDRLYFHVSGKKKLVRGASSRFFRVLKNEQGIEFQLYGRDNSSVFYFGEKIEGADAKTFKFLGGTRGGGLYFDGYTSDINNAYFMGKQIEGVDIQTFEYLTGTIAKDANHVYSSGEIYGQFDIESFEMLNEYFFKDKYGVYYELSPLADSEPIDVMAMDCFVRANNHIYVFDKQLVLDAPTFEIIHLFKNYDSCGGMTLQGALVKDKFGLYFQMLEWGYADSIDMLYELDAKSFKKLGMPNGLYSRNANFEDMNGRYKIYVNTSKRRIIIDRLEDKNK